MRFELSSPSLLCTHFKIVQSVGHTKSSYETALSTYGKNELEKAPSTPLYKLILAQFDDALVKILLMAALVSFALAFIEEEMGAYVEPFVILVILILNAMVGVWQESNAEEALEALKELQPEHARVLRDSVWKTIPSCELVPGDIIQIRVGDKIPADARMIALETTSLRVEQAQLTGESVSVNKDIEALDDDIEEVIQNKTNMVFAATVVVNGMGRAIVVTTGMHTEIGKIQASVQAAAEDEEPTPLKKKLDEFGDMLSKVILVICILVWAINYKNFFDPSHGSTLKGCIYYFKIAVALAVAAIPEGLPAVITTCLALGTRKMAKKNAIVRKLPSVETLGCTSVICSDKTGTLTTNEMSAIAMVLPSTSATAVTEFTISGNTYAPIGEITPKLSFDSYDNAAHLAEICAVCNNATIEYNGDKYVRVGEPTEASLKVLVEKIGSPSQKITEQDRNKNPSETVSKVCNEWNDQLEKLATLEFARDRKSMSVLVKDNDGANHLLVKGAPEGLLTRCSKIHLSDGSIVTMTAAARKTWLEQVSSFGSQALRCLAFAYRDETAGSILATYDGTKGHAAHARLSQPPSTFAELESDLIFVGLVGMLDPPRAEIAPMIKVCTTAGIRVIMITGDNKRTAEAIAVKVGILPTGFAPSRSFTGGEFFNLSEDAQMDVLHSTSGGLVFSRTEPTHKQILVKLLKRNGDVVAMTGDGVNDAPALKQADIGIAMGITGTEVAKEAADMVLADDNFATIVSAVEEGRAIYNNMQAFIRYLISSNIGEVMAIFFTAALGTPEGLIPVQLLWVNLVTDGPPATALGFNPADKEIMQKLPRKNTDALITPWVFFRYCVVGFYVGFACVGIFIYWFLYYTASNDGHTLITFDQLSNWGKCPTWTDFTVSDFDGINLQDDPCLYFSEGKVTASTLSLSVLVTIEMLNALNALSEDGSLVTMPPWRNPYLLVAMLVSMAMHMVILYVDILAVTFSVTPLDFEEWKLVMLFSMPVIFIDEGLKYMGRYLARMEMKKRTEKLKEH